MEKTYKSVVKTQFDAFDNMLEGVSVYKLIFNDNGEVINLILEYLNSSAVETIDIDPEEAIGKSVRKILGPDFAKSYIELINEFRATGKYKRFEVYYPPTDKHFLISGFNMPDNFFAILRVDITEQKKAEKSLRESEKRYYALFKNNYAVMLLINPDTGNIVDANPAACSFYGYKKEELLKMKITDLNILTDKQIFEEMQKAKLEQKNHFVFKHRLANGEIRDVDTYSGPIIVGGEKVLYSIIHDITEQRKAEEALRQSEEQYRLLFENMTEGFALCEMIWDDKGNPVDWVYLQVNNAWVEQTGLSIKKTVGRTVSEVIPDIEHYWIDTYGQVVKTGKPVNYENYASGLDRWYETFAFKHSRNQFAILFIDISERKDAEIKLEEERVRLQTIIENLPVGIFIGDDKGKGVFVNEMFYKIWGTNAPVPGSVDEYREYKGWFTDTGKLIGADEWGGARALKGESITQTVDIQRFDGKKATIILSAVPITNPEGVITGNLAVIQDITKIRNLEKELRQARDHLEEQVEERTADLKRSETILQEATRLSSVGAYEWNIKEDKFIFSREWKRIHGVKEDSLPSIELLKIAYPEDAERIQRTLNESIDGKIPYNIEHRIINQSNGEIRYIHALGTIIKDENGNPTKMYGVAHDITESKLASIEREKLIDELKRSNYELQQFAYITSHDLQEPLRTMSSYAGLLKRRYEGKLDPDADDFIEYMVSGAARMKAMIQGLLDYSRVGTCGGEFKKFNAENALNIALNNLESLIEDNNAEIIYDGLPEIFADEDQITRVFQNLISNAIKFRKKDENPRVHISAKKEDEEWVFSVKDNSIGMEQEYTDKIFEIFKRLHAIGKYEGAGIGLAIVKRVIDRHNGRVWAESEPGKGSVFYFTVAVKD